MNVRQKPANANAVAASARGPWLLEWLARLTQPGLSLDELPWRPLDAPEPAPVAGALPHNDDWHAVAHICGYGARDFAAADAPLPLTVAEIEHFRRNHRGTAAHISRDFLTAQTELPSPLAELYGLYRHRARIDSESALFLAQSTGSTRVARVMADLLAIGGFANAGEYIGYLGLTYSVSAAFDTAAQIDCANQEALRRLAVPADHPSHLLKLKPDELGVLAAQIAEAHALPPADFLEKANLLSEARQDVARLPCSQHFSTALIERDLPMHQAWMIRLAGAYARILPSWVSGLPEIQALMN